jgi:hypothetical protein
MMSGTSALGGLCTSDALQTGACGFVPDYIPPPNDGYYRKPRPASAWAP